MGKLFWSCHERDFLPWIQMNGEMVSTGICCPQLPEGHLHLHCFHVNVKLNELSSRIVHNAYWSEYYSPVCFWHLYIHILFAWMVLISVSSVNFYVGLFLIKNSGCVNWGYLCYMCTNWWISISSQQEIWVSFHLVATPGTTFQPASHLFPLYCNI